MMYFNYSDKNERVRIITEREAQGETMVSDTFDPDWKPGDEIRGVMVFSRIQPIEMPTNVSDKDSFKAAKTDSERITIIAKKLGLVEAK